MVTHDQEEALDLSDQLVVMNLGRVEQVGTAAGVYAKPATSFVASFVGSANVLRGDVLDGQVRVGDVRLPLAGGASDGTRVQAVVRPHEVRIERPNIGSVDFATLDRGQATKHIRRIVDLGTHFKLDLDLPTREIITVHLPRRDFEVLAVKKGEPVRWTWRVPRYSSRITRSDLAKRVGQRRGGRRGGRRPCVLPDFPLRLSNRPGVAR